MTNESTVHRSMDRSARSAAAARRKAAELAAIREAVTALGVSLGVIAASILCLCAI